MSEKKQSSRKPMCSKCRGHKRKQPYKGHKKSCPFSACKCDECHLISQRQNIARQQIALQRDKEKITQQTQSQDSGVVYTQASNSYVPPSYQMTDTVGSGAYDSGGGVLTSHHHHQPPSHQDANSLSALTNTTYGHTSQPMRTYQVPESSPALSSSVNSQNEYNRVYPQPYFPQPPATTSSVADSYMYGSTEVSRVSWTSGRGSDNAVNILSPSRSVPQPYSSPYPPARHTYQLPNTPHPPESVQCQERSKLLRELLAATASDHNVAGSHLRPSKQSCKSINLPQGHAESGAIKSRPGVLKTSTLTATKESFSWSVCTNQAQRFTNSTALYRTASASATVTSGSVRVSHASGTSNSCSRPTLQNSQPSSSTVGSPARSAGHNEGQNQQLLSLDNIIDIYLPSELEFDGEVGYDNSAATPSSLSLGPMLNKGQKSDEGGNLPSDTEVSDLTLLFGSSAGEPSSTSQPLDESNHEINIKYVNVNIFQNLLDTFTVANNIAIDLSKSSCSNRPKIGLQANLQAEQSIDPAPESPNNASRSELQAAPETPLVTADRRPRLPNFSTFTKRLRKLKKRPSD